MAGQVKGITIEFRGETTSLEKALQKVNSETKSIDKELTQVNKDLKFNPKSIELWRQKQSLLETKISETKDKLKLLKQQQDRMDADGVDKNSREYQKLRREIVETESKLKTFNGQLAKSKAPALKAASAQFASMGEALTNAGNAMRGFSAAGAAVVGTLGALTVKSAKFADDLNTMSKIYGMNTKQLQLYGAAANLVDVDLNTIASTHMKLEKNMMSASEGSKKMSSAFAELGISVTDSNGELRNGDEVWQETITALSKVENETKRDALAMQLMGKSAAELNPLIEDGGETYKNLAETFSQYNIDFIDQETLDKANQFNDQLDIIKSIGLVTLQNLGAQLSEYLLPVLEKVVGWVGKAAEWLSTLDPEVLAIIGTVAAVVAGLAPVLLILGKLAFAISSIMNLMSIIGPAIGGIITAAGPVVAVIAGIIAVGVLLYKNWDTIKAKAQELWTALKAKFEAIKTSIVTTWDNIKTKAVNTFNAIKDAITHPIETARDVIKKVIDKIKSFFDFKVKLPHIDLPHFTIDPPGWKLGDLLKGKIPKLGIGWHAEGGIFTRPTLLASANGGLHGVGEAGAEAILPLNKLWEKLDNIAYGNGVIINVYGGATSDPQAIALEVERRLVKLQKQRSQAWT